MRFGIGRWDDVARGGGELVRFIRPRDLDRAGAGRLGRQSLSAARRPALCAERAELLGGERIVLVGGNGATGAAADGGARLRSPPPLLSNCWTPRIV